MTRQAKAAMLSAILTLGLTSTAGDAQPRPPVLSPDRDMGRMGQGMMGQGMMMGQGPMMGQAPMMNNPEMLRQMSEMARGCERMMSEMAGMQARQQTRR